MVKVLASNRQQKKATVELSLNDVYDIVNAVNIMVGLKEEEIARYEGDQLEREQLARYRICLVGMQQVKERILEG